MVAAVSLSACKPERREMVSATSPDGRVNAALFRVSAGGATVGFFYELYLSEDADTDKFDHDNLTMSYLENPKLEWKDRILTVSYSKGLVHDFYGAWHAKTYAKDGYKVEIRLSPECDGMCF